MIAHGGIAANRRRRSTSPLPNEGTSFRIPVPRFPSNLSACLYSALTGPSHIHTHTVAYRVPPLFSFADAITLPPERRYKLKGGNDSKDKWSVYRVLESSRQQHQHNVLSVVSTGSTIEDVPSLANWGVYLQHQRTCVAATALMKAPAIHFPQFCPATRAARAVLHFRRTDQKDSLSKVFIKYFSQPLPTSSHRVSIYRIQLPQFPLCHCLFSFLHFFFFVLFRFLNPSSQPRQKQWLVGVTCITKGSVGVGTATSRPLHLFQRAEQSNFHHLCSVAFIYISK